MYFLPEGRYTPVFVLPVAVTNQWTVAKGGPVVIKVVAF